MELFFGADGERVGVFLERIRTEADGTGLRRTVIAAVDKEAAVGSIAFSAVVGMNHKRVFAGLGNDVFFSAEIQTVDRVGGFSEHGKHLAVADRVIDNGKRRIRAVTVARPNKRRVGKRRTVCGIRRNVADVVAIIADACSTFKILLPDELSVFAGRRFHKRCRRAVIGYGAYADSEKRKTEYKRQKQCDVSFFHELQTSFIG